MSFTSLYKWFCLGSCACSYLLNGLLIFIVHTRRTRIGFYRFFTLSTVLIGVLYSIAFATVQPFWYASLGMLGFFSIAPWQGNVELIRYAFHFWFTSFILILMCMACSFAYRYGILC
ncbi:hypothetical protein PMAYCL1PPCAC_15331, partial [Pristionchus mayeri]